MEALQTGESTILKRTLVLLLVLAVLTPATALAQTRRRTSRPAKSTASQKASEVQRLAAVRVADHIKNLTRFTYLLGGVARGVEQTDISIRKNEASPAIIEQAKRNKQTLATSFRTWREAMDKLEIDFRTTPELQRYYIKLAGVAASAASAEELAVGGKYEPAGRSLLDVVNRLTDVLVEMRT